MRLRMAVRTMTSSLSCTAGYRNPRGELRRRRKPDSQAAGWAGQRLDTVDPSRLRLSLSKIQPYDR